MTESPHFESETLQSFLLGQLASQQTRDVVRHLLSGCEVCHQVTQTLLSPTKGNVDTSSAASPFSADRVLQTVRQREKMLEMEREEAPLLFAELEPHPVARQVMILRNSPRLHTWGLCEYLLRRSSAARFDDAEQTVKCAEVAVALAEQLPSERYGQALVQDLKARAWGYLANAYKIRGDLRAADEYMRLAEALICEGTDDPLERALLLRFKAALRKDQGRHEESLRLYDRIIAIYKRLGDDDQLGQALNDKAMVLEETGEIEEAIRLTRQSLQLVDTVSNPRSKVVASHNLIFLLKEAGDLTAALELLRETRPLYAELGDRLNLLRLRRLEGQLAHKLGHTALAEAAFLEARNGFISQGIGLDAAEISLELAAVYLEQGRTHETRQLAVQMMPIFQAQDLHQEALSALILFQRAAQADRVTQELIGDILAYFDRSRDEPTLKFRRGLRNEAT